MGFILFLLFLSVLTFLYLCIKERRSLFFGIVFISMITLFITNLVFLFLYYNFTYLNMIIGPLIVLIILTLAFILLIGPIIFIVFLLLQGVKLIYKEGITVRNFLAISLGVFLLISPFITSYLVDFSNGRIPLLTLVNIYGIIASYIMIIASAFTLSSFLNFFNWKRRDLKYIVVLGSGLRGDQVTPLLKSRIDKAINIYRGQKKCKMIMSGGQGEDELIPESVAMLNYAVNSGVSKEDIITETQSKNTRENIQLSYNLMMGKPERIAIVTNYYHLFRALLIAKENKIKCIGYGAPTKLYFSLNAFIREFIGYLAMKYKFHLFLLTFFITLYLIYTLVY